MWANVGLLVWESEGNWAAGEHHQRERGLGGVEPVGAAGDEPHLVVERLDPGVVDPNRVAARMPWRCLRMVPARVTNGARRLRLALAHQRSNSWVVSLG
jgi:hypothetical protein